MSRGVALLGAGAVVLIGLAVWLALAARAPVASPPIVVSPPSTDPRPPASPPIAAPPPPPIAAPRPPTSPPQAWPNPDPRPMISPPPTPPIATPTGPRVITPLDVRLDESRLRLLSEPVAAKIRVSFDESLREARERIAADRSLDEVLAPVRGARVYLRDELKDATDPADTIAGVLSAFEELERQAALRAPR